MQTITDLKNSIPQTGRVEFIGIARERRGTIELQSFVMVEPGKGIIGEHHANSGKSRREVTLIQAEHLPVIASLCGRDEVLPELPRRNIVVSGINLLALKDRYFKIGTANLLGTGNCAPCSRMEELLGPGGYNAMRGHGGITSVVQVAGEIRIGDTVQLIVSETEPAESDADE